LALPRKQASRKTYLVIVPFATNEPPLSGPPAVNFTFDKLTVIVVKVRSVIVIVPEMGYQPRSSSPDSVW
jgi:hypothetical protein